MSTRTKWAKIGTTALVGCLLATGCDEGRELDLHDPSADAQGEPLRAHGPEALATTWAYPSALHLSIEDAILRPWCSGVLIAPDVAVTATHCTLGIGAFELTVAQDAPGTDGPHAVDRIVELEHDPRLSALLLEEPILDVEPATPTTLTERSCDVWSIAYRYVLDHDGPLERWLWSGCYSPDTHFIEPVEGGPNCHGDMGAPAFDEHGDLVGVAVFASNGDPCVQQVTLAVLQSGAFEEGLALSR